MRINDEARPQALQIALVIPLLVSIVGLFWGFQMMRLPDPAPTDAPEAAASLADSSPVPGDAPSGVMRNAADATQSKREE